MELSADTCVKTLTSYGTFMIDSVHYKVDGQLGYERVLVITDGDKIIVTTIDGEVLIEHTRPEPGVKYVGNGRPRGRRPLSGGDVTDVLTHEVPPMS